MSWIHKSEGGIDWGFLGVLVAVGILAATMGWFVAAKPISSAPPIEVSSPTLSDPVQVSIAAPVKAYKPTVKQQTALGAGLKADPKKHLVAVTKAERNEQPVEVATVIDQDTGDVTTVVTALPKPWLDLQPRTELFAEYGFKYPTNKLVTRIGVNHQLLKVKGLSLGLTAHADTDREAFVGLRASMRF